MENLERRSYSWFERRRRTKALELAQQQITKALDTVNLLNQTAQKISESKKKEAMQLINNLFEVEKEVDTLRTTVFEELSKGVALLAEHREDIMNIVNRLDDLADYVKDAARSIKLLADSQIPKELWDNIVNTTSTLVRCADALRGSIEKITVNPSASLKEAKKVEQIESEIDEDYLKIKSLFIKYEDIVDNLQTTLQRILDEIHLEYEMGMENYEEKEQYLLGGNAGPRYKIAKIQNGIESKFESTIQRDFYQNIKGIEMDNNYRKFFSTDEIHSIYEDKKIKFLMNNLEYRKIY